ncbi:MAG: hypothetical protein LBK67_05590 [Coriobacteriales bacterium]|jgi:hypothetical protein|nr:hypothetical protein [Coriobacteriales bacterium]
MKGIDFSPAVEFDRAALFALFQSFDERLEQEGFCGSIFIVGGAAMALEYSALRVTTDIDAVFSPRSDIERIVTSFAEERGLPKDWLNTHVSAMLGYFKGDEQARTVFSGKNLTVSVASPEYLFASKIIAGRDKDRDDAAVLAKELGAFTVRDMQIIVERYYRGEITPGEYRGDVILSMLQDIEDMVGESVEDHS